MAVMPSQPNVKNHVASGHQGQKGDFHLLGLTHCSGPRAHCLVSHIFKEVGCPFSGIAATADGLEPSS